MNMSKDFDLNIKLKLLPLQLIETADAVILRRGCSRIKIAGQGAAQGVRLLLAAVSEEGATPREIYASFPRNLHASVQHLIQKLVSSRFLVPTNGTKSLTDQESGLDVFYWNFSAMASEVTTRLKDTHIVLVGVNYISRQLATALVVAGLDKYQVVDIPMLRNHVLFGQDGSLLAGQWPTHLELPVTEDKWWTNGGSLRVDCVVVCSDFVSMEQFRGWNQICVARKWSLFPILLDGLIGNIGPFIIPDETACYECLYCRQNSNLINFSTERKIDSASLEGQEVIGLLPSMATVLADLASFELVKLYSGVLPVQNVGRLLEVNLLASQLTSRKIVKIPRCLVCSPLVTKPSSNARKAVLAQIAKS